MAALCTAGSTQPSGFTYYYPDTHPTAFVSFLGAGHQGAAILVRSMINGKLYVRKRSRTAHKDGSSGANETTNAIPHPNIPRLVAQTPLWSSDCGTSSANSSITADLWAHCNGGNLRTLTTKYVTRNERVPELLIWQLMHQLLPTILYLHEQDIAHSDLTPDNIFVHWAMDTTTCPTSPSTPPRFLLGDFGCSYNLPPDDKVKISHGVSETSEAVYGDLACLAGCISFVMRGRAAGGKTLAKRGVEYSRGLLRAQDTLVSLPGLLQKFKVARACDGEMFTRILEPLLKDIETGLRCEEEVDHRLDFRHLRPRRRKLARGPFVFPSKAALLASPYRPPGPWSVAEVDNEGHLVQVDLLERYCENQAMMTKHGREVDEGEIRQEWKEACG